jgi:hypothetical protein
MAVKFNAGGYLDVSTDPADLPVQSDGKNVIAPNFTRLTNLHQDRAGVVSTRRGSSKVSATSVGTTPHTIIEQAGYRYVFSGTQIYRNEVSLGASGLVSAKWSAIKYSAYNVTTQSLFALNGTNRKRITGTSIAEWGIDAPASAPVVSSGSGSSKTFGVLYTYARKSGSTVECESNPSPAASVDTDGTISIEWVVPSDPQVTHVRIYRTLDDGATYYRMGDLAVALASANIVAADENLGAEVETDHDRPPLGTIVLGPDFNGYCFIVKDNLLYFCKPGQPEYWPANYYVEISPPQEDITGARLYNGQVYCQTKSDIILVQGSGYQSFFPIRQSAFTGGVSNDAMLPLRGVGLLRFANDGLWAFGTTDENITNRHLRPVFVGETAGSIPGLNRPRAPYAWAVLWRNKVYLGYPGGTDNFPGDVLVWDVAAKRISHYDYGRQFRCVTVDAENDRILAIDVTGYIWELEDPDETDDEGTAIAWDWQTSIVSDQVRQQFPRYAKYDVSVGDSAVATAHIMLDGSSVQSHTLSGDRVTRKRLVTTCTGKRLQVRIAGTGSVSIWAAEVE